MLKTLSLLGAFAAVACGTAGTAHGGAESDSAGSPAARGATIRVHADKVLHRVTEWMIGANIEDLNYQCYGGLYSQLLYGESFQEHVDCDVLGITGKDRLYVLIEENDRGEIEVWGRGTWRWEHDGARRILHLPPQGISRPIAMSELPAERREALLRKATGDEQLSRHWRKLHSGSAQGSLRFERQGAFVGRQSQRIALLSGDGEFGIDNAGLNRWGIDLRPGKNYEGLLRVKAEQDCKLYVSLLAADGSTKLAEKELALKGMPGQYQRIEFTLTPGAADEQGRFGIALKQPGSIVVGYAFLQPGPWGRFQGLPLRKDLVEAIIAQGVKLMRYGGSMINKLPDGHLYKWKEMIGPRDLRKPYRGYFNPYASHGFGIFEFLDFCEAAGFLPIVALRIDETPQDMADFVQYVNGPADSPWGKRRATNGHPQPYNLQYIEIGNEERFGEYYRERFETLGSAIWSKDPSITLLIANNLGRPEDWVIRGDGAPSEPLKLAARLVEFAKKRGGKIWWDCHYRADELRTAESPAGRIAAMRNLKESISKLVPDYDFQIAALEENAESHNMLRALSHACNHNWFTRLGDWVPAVAVANTLQANGQEIVWSQGKTFFTASKVFFQPPYYVDQMLSQNWATNVVQADCQSPQNALDVVATTTADGKVLVLQVVNLEPIAMEATIALSGFQPKRSQAAVTQLAGELAAENTLEEPTKIAPVRSQWEHGNSSGAMRYTFPPYSFTILRLE
jgi:alpha-L-arabinofuranosidase